MICESILNAEVQASSPYQDWNNILSLRLLLDILLRAPLRRLSIVVLQTIPFFCLTVTSNASPNTAEASLDTVLHATSKVAELAFGLNTLSSSILLLPFLLQSLHAKGVTNSFLS